MKAHLFFQDLFTKDTVQVQALLVQKSAGQQKKSPRAKRPLLPAKLFPGQTDLFWDVAFFVGR